MDAQGKFLELDKKLIEDGKLMDKAMSNLMGNPCQSTHAAADEAVQRHGEILKQWQAAGREAGILKR